jgi:O-antigen/teichoic acid export membrane protein
MRRPIDAIFLGKSLKAGVLRGGVWLGGGSVVEQMLRFGRNIILVRLLAPTAFGTMAIALSSASLVDALADVGVSTAVIRNPRGG